MLIRKQINEKISLQCLLITTLARLCHSVREIISFPKTQLETIFLVTNLVYYGISRQAEHKQLFKDETVSES